MSERTSPNHSRAREGLDIVAKKNSSKLDNIAAEIFLKVVELLHSAKDLASLSNTCRRFRDLIRRDGWRIFVQINFPSLPLELPHGIESSPSQWRELARCCTTQSRAWDKRAISAVSLDPISPKAIRLQNAFLSDLQFEQYEAQGSKADKIHCLQRWDKASKSITPYLLPERLRGGSSAKPGWVFSSPQYLPFRPAIDSKLEFYGNLSSKKQTVAWSTGHEVYIRVRRSGSCLAMAEGDPYDRCSAFDEYSNKINWFTVQHNEFLFGVDDVASINLLEPSTEIRESPSGTLVVDAIVGMASGYLHRYSVSNKEPVRVVANTFHSFWKGGTVSRQSVRSADLNSKTRASMLAACSDKVISLYKTEAESHDVWPIAEFELDLPNPQAWIIKFSSRDNLLLGLGHSRWPLYAYKATPNGLVLTEKFVLQRDSLDESDVTPSSIHAIEPISVASRAGGSNNGDIFLSGGCDGVCRLYDRRAGLSPVRLFYDPVDREPAIFSLASFCQERFLAGSANCILKIFDFRNGSKVYHYTDGVSCSISPPSPETYSSSSGGGGRAYSCAGKCHHDLRTDVARTCHFHTRSRMDMYRPNTGLHIYGMPRPSRPSYLLERHEKFPIFALSSPDPICPLVYVGTTGEVYELEVSEMNMTGDLIDPYFAAPPLSGHLKQSQRLFMYEMDDSDSAQVTSVMPNSTWIQQPSPPTLSKSFNRNKNEIRLDARWRPLD